MRELLHIHRLIPTIAEAVQYLYQQLQEGKTDSAYLVTNINEASLTIHQTLLPECPELALPPALTEENFSDSTRLEESCLLLEQLHEWLSQSEELCVSLICGDRPPALRERLDAQFLSLIESIRGTSYDKILYHINKTFQKLPDPTQKGLEDYFRRFGFWGTLNISKKDHSVFENRARALAEHWPDFLWLYERLCDYRSRFTLLAFLTNWYDFDFSRLGSAKEHIYHDYFDLDILRCGPEEVMVDLGAFIGDTVHNYVETYSGYKRIYCYEITPNTFATLQRNLGSLQNIVYRQKGASDTEGVMYISENSDTSANILSDSGLIAVETTTIDRDIQEPVTLIKMDIEGSEQKALLGCAGHIRNEKPKLAISVYHNNEDIWKIARMIEDICPGYRFYLRYHGGNMVPTEMTLLAVYPS